MVHEKLKGTNFHTAIKNHLSISDSNLQIEGVFRGAQLLPALRSEKSNSDLIILKKLQKHFSVAKTVRKYAQKSGSA